MELHEKIKKLRKDRRWSQAELAQKLAVHLSHVSKLETAKYSPSLDVLKKLIEVFEVPPEFFLYEDSADPTEPMNIKDKSFYEKMRMIEQLGEDDRDIIMGVIEAFLVKQRVVNAITKEAVPI